MTNKQTNKKVAIMQPYFFPYVGYFQLINAVDAFIIYDNIKYTKKGWINRNRILSHGSDTAFSLPLKKASDTLDIREREVAADFNRPKLLNQLREAYRKAPYQSTVVELVEDVLMGGDQNLFAFLHRSLERTCKFLAIPTRVIVSSTVDIDHSLQSQDKVIALCRAVDADTYINPIGGVELYSKDVFAGAGIELKFLRSRLVEYPQFDTAFVPWLSIIDVMMFNSVQEIQKQLSGGYDLM
jgi:hypothetical protein